MNRQIFISYRREDSAHVAGRLFDRLSQRFGKERIFMDIDTIELGADFVKRIEEALSTCDVVIALIGKDWLTTKNAEGNRRLDNPNDFVRLELSIALDRNITVIPVLIDGTKMPPKDELPDALSPLSFRNGMSLDYMRFDADVSKLIKSLDETLKGAARIRRREKVNKKRLGLPLWGWFMAGFVIVLVAGIFGFNIQKNQRVENIIYDNFENPAFDGDYDHSKWINYQDMPDFAMQENGLLALRSPGSQTALIFQARHYEEIKSGTPMFFEARMRLDPDEHENGVVSMSVTFGSSSGEQWDSVCGINDFGPSAFCWEGASWASDYLYQTKDKPTNAGNWHTFRIEIDFENLQFTYYVDGEFQDSHIPDDVEKIKNRDWSVWLQVWSDSTPVTGYYDDVRIGELNK